MSPTTPTLQPKTPRDSRTEMAEYVLPNETNPLGNIFGGRVMALIDIAASIASHRHTRRAVVTASMDELVFHHPIRVGHIVILEAQVNEAFNTSVEVGVNVFSENPLTGERRHTSTAYLTFVALDDLGRPTRVPALAPETDEEKRRQAEARGRKAERLARRRAREEAAEGV